MHRPFSTAAVTRRALDDLRDIAVIMHSRQQHPDDMLHDLAARAALWFQHGADINDRDVLRAVRSVVPDYQPYADLQHAIMRDRIHDAIAAMQARIAGEAYRDGVVDGWGTPSPEANTARDVSPDQVLMDLLALLKSDHDAAVALRHAIQGDE